MTLRELLTKNSGIETVCIHTTVTKYGVNTDAKLFICEVDRTGDQINLIDFVDKDGKVIYPQVNLDTPVTNWSILAVHYIGVTI